MLYNLVGLCNSAVAYHNPVWFAFSIACPVPVLYLACYLCIAFGMSVYGHLTSPGCCLGHFHPGGVCHYSPHVVPITYRPS